jgi:hypothetical protein
MDVQEIKELLERTGVESPLPWKRYNATISVPLGEYSTAAAYAGTEDHARLIELAVNGLPGFVTIVEERDRLRADLERASELSVVGLCQSGLDGKHSALEDIQKIGKAYGADALGSFSKVTG